MNRYLLDTNIIIYLILSELDNISKETTEIITNYNQLFVSSVSIIELLQLFRLGKIKSKKYKNQSLLLDAIENDFNINILPFTEQHAQTLACLKITTAHNDPFDHAIISHAIADRLILISSDRKFKDYTTQKLQFIFNKR